MLNYKGWLLMFHDRLMEVGEPGARGPSIGKGQLVHQSSIHIEASEYLSHQTN